MLMNIISSAADRVSIVIPPDPAFLKGYVLPAVSPTGSIAVMRREQRLLAGRRAFVCCKYYRR